MNFTDPGEVCLSGDNPFMILLSEGRPVTLASLWRIDLSPVGPGQVLFLNTDLTGAKNRIYTDSVALAHYIQTEIYANNPGPFQGFRDPDAELFEAVFLQSGDARSNITERVESRAEHLSLSWYDFLPPYKGGTAADPASNRAHSHYAVYVPARRARLSVNDRSAPGEPHSMLRDGRPTTTAALALAETWTRPPAPEQANTI